MPDIVVQGYISSTHLPSPFSLLQLCDFELFMIICRNLFLLECKKKIELSMIIQELSPTSASLVSEPCSAAMFLHRVA